MNNLNVLNAIPFFKEALTISKNPKYVATLVKTNPKIGADAQKMINLANTNPNKALKVYTSKIDSVYQSTKVQIDKDKFVEEAITRRTPLTIDQYSQYVSFRLINDLKVKPAVAVILAILFTSVGTFWKILSFGRYQLTKELADRLISRIQRRGLTLQSFLTIGTLVFQVGLVFLMQIFMIVGGFLFALVAKKSILTALGSLLYIFIVTIVAIIILAQSGYAATKGIELSREFKKREKK